VSHADPTRRFSDRVDDYVRYRPRYPAGVVRVLEEEVELGPEWVIADVGAGTGLSAEPFLANGNVVFAVEPNAEMRAAAESLHGDGDFFHSVAGTAEATTLAPASVDLVVAAQAFHWFDPPTARDHFATILREPGRVVLLWNTRRTGSSAFLLEYEALLDDFGTDYPAVRHDRIDPAVLADFFRGGYVRRTLGNEQRLDGPGLEGRLLSSSYTPGPADPRRGPMLERLREIFERHRREGRVVMEYELEMYIGRVC
jgi:SAM-dependent methyltransferase